MSNIGKNKFKESGAGLDNKLVIAGSMDIESTSTFEIEGTQVVTAGLADKLNNLEAGTAVTGIVALIAGGQTGATALTGEYNNVTTVASDFDSVKLPTAVSGLKIKVKNSGASVLSVFPFLADSINGLAVNLSVDVPIGAEVIFNAITDTIWESNESVYLSAPTTQTGGIELKATDNGGNFIVTVTNEAHGQDTTVNIPDSGLADSYVAQSTAALTVGEVDVLDTAVAGEVIISKAVIYDASGKVAVSSGDIAATGTVIGDATAMTAEMNVISGANGAAGVILPVATVDARVTVINSNTSNDLLVYPVSGSQINALGASNAFTITAGQTGTFVARSTTLWNVASATDTVTGLTATAAELNKNDLSAESETIDSGVAVSALKKITQIDNTSSGAGAITLAVPDTSMYGLVKTIEMTVDNGDVTLTLTNVVGGSAATTCTWANVGETLVLVGGVSKWTVVGEGGVVLS